MSPAKVSDPPKPVTYSTAHEIRVELLKALAPVESFEECSLLDYPNYFNVGDHLIWLGLLTWLRHTRKARVNYISNNRTFSEKHFETKSRGNPVFFTGGGNLGDLWPDHQRFRERIISKYHDRPIVIMPQSIYFKEQASLRRAQDIFNAHPDLTLFTRDLMSYKIAGDSFPRCRVLKAPDLAFHLADWIATLPLPQARLPLLLQYRDDQEIHDAARKPPLPLSIQGRVEEDWPSMKRGSKWRQKIINKFPFFWRSPSLNGIISRGPVLWREPLVSLAKDLSELALSPSNYLRSLDLSLEGIRQLMRFRFIVTNRLHGHILSVLLEKPNALLKNSYHKNEAFYFTWTQGIPSCRFDPDLSLLGSEIDRLS